MAQGEIDAASGAQTAAANAGIMYEFNLDSGELKWNDTLYSLLGFPRTEPLDRLEWWVGHIHPDDAMILNQAMDKLDDPKAPGWTVNYRFRGGDGAYVFVRDRASILRGPDGRATGLIGTLSINPAQSRGISPDEPLPIAPSAPPAAPTGQPVPPAGG
ncbi:MAG TPA: PAS domain-containing protein [Candidatus Saccharimonadales bacterium]|nr:PAS domain-containing protein [Candidatus Saccharimonadales bacterium]